MQIDKRNRTELKTFFVKNAIPSESNFADLIDGALNQRDDGIAKPPGDALAIEAAGDATSQKKAIQFYTSFADTDPSWLLSLNPRQTPADAATARAGFSISDGAGNSRLFIDRATGRVGMGTNNPQVALEVTGGVQANGFRARYDLVLNDYRTANPAFNVCLQSPGADRDAWIYRDITDAASNWGIYHRQINTVIAGLPDNSIGFIGGGSSKLQAYVSLADGSGFFAGKLAVAGDMSIAGKHAFRGNDTWLRLNQDAAFTSGVHTPGNFAPNSLNVGGVNGWGNPGAGNAWFAGAIIPSVGNSSARGIQFPSDPGGGSGDEAFIRYYPVSGEACKLMIGINNDADDTIGFLVAAAERMTVGPGWVDVLAEGNTLRFTSAWSGFPDSGLTNRAEISNDINTYKTLMLVGNRSSGTRRVSVWDRLEVNGSFWVNGTQRFDLAEVTPARAGDQLEQGDVVVIDRDEGTRVCRSTRPYDTAAYGVVSSYHQAAMVIGGFGGAEEMSQSADKRPIALVGRVKVKVCGESGAIRAGDLLTTSSLPGHAMRCAEPAAHPGAIIGKALEPFTGETGTVTALVTLQ